MRILDGKLKGKTVYTYRPFLRQVDPAYAKLVAARRKSRPPLDKMAIAAAVRAALNKAQPDEAAASLHDKKALVRKAVEPVCAAHKAEYQEVNAIATAAGVTVTLGKRKYDLGGNLLSQ
ncbi:MAG: hypothetical protein U0871_11990 [Gemmataceae bacterium]